MLQLGPAYVVFNASFALVLRSLLPTEPSLILEESTEFALSLSGPTAPFLRRSVLMLAFLSRSAAMPAFLMSFVVSVPFLMSPVVSEPALMSLPAVSLAAPAPPLTPTTSRVTAKTTVGIFRWLIFMAPSQGVATRHPVGWKFPP